jgi:hypothetical protein
MKKNTTQLLLFILLTAGAANAQLQQGNALVGARIADIDLSLNEGGTFSFQLSPSVAWFIRTGIAVGAYMNFGLITSKGAGTTFDYGVGALGRYYISDPSINLLRQGRFFLEGSVGIEGTNPASGENTNGLGLTFGPGWTYFVTPTVGLEGLVKYRGIIGFGERATSSNLHLSVGFQIYLTRSRIEQTIRDVQ